MHADRSAAPVDNTAEEAARRGDWTAARDAFAASAAAGDPAGWAGIALASRNLGDLDGAMAARERALALHRELGDMAGAARAAAWLAHDTAIVRGDLAIARGFFATAQRLLAQAGEARADEGWVLFLEAEVALLVEVDVERAGELGARASAIGREVGDIDLELVAQSLNGLALVASGVVADGMAILDGVAAASMAGELSGFDGLVRCHLIFACERTDDVDRAAQWCDRMRDVAEQTHSPHLFGMCRAHYASVLVTRGDFDDAETELTGAAELLAHGAPSLAFEATLRLAALRARQGRYDDVRRLCEPHAWHPMAQLCLARAAFADADLDAAADLLDRHADALPHGDRLARAPALELRARVALARGRVDDARAAAAELVELAGFAGTAALRATAALVQGLVALADGEYEAARRSIQTAVDLWNRVGARYDAARARADLADALDAGGRRDRAAAERAAAQAELRGLGVSRQGAIGSQGDDPLTARELEVVRLAAAGMSNPAIAERLVVSPHTVHRHMANIRVKLGAETKAAAVAQAARLGLL